jgi:hypothetical protein
MMVGLISWRSVGMIVAVGLFATCANSPLVPVREAELVGEIVGAGPGLWSGDETGALQVHVKEGLADACGIIFTVHSETLIADSRGGETRDASESILMEGAMVAVWFDYVQRSCPGQSRAEAIERRE